MVDYWFPATGGGGVPHGVRALMREPDVSGVIVTTDHDLRSRVPHPPDVRLADDRGTPVDYVPARAPRLWRRILGHRPDVVLLTSPFSRRTIRVLVGRRLATIRRRRAARDLPHVVLWSQGEMGARALADKPRRKRWFLGAARRLGLFDGVSWFVVDPLERPAVERLVKRTPEHFPYGLPDPGDERPRPPKRAGELDLAFVGRVVPRKGVLLALEALRDVDGRVRFTIYGPREDAEYAARCDAAIERLPPNVTASFAGAIDERLTAAVFHDHHASILATEYESFGFAIFESLAEGCVPVVSRMTPFDFSGGPAGLHVELTADSVRSALQTLVDDDESGFARRSRAARDLAVEMRAADRHASTMVARLAELARATTRSAT